MTEPTGYTALDLIGFTDQGDYDSSTAYVKNDLVHYDNSVWRCLVDDTTGQTPAEGTYWTIFVESTVGSTIISDAYDSTATYAAGDYFIYDNTLYYVDVACTGITPPNTSYYTATSVSTEIGSLNSNLNGSSIYTSLYSTYISVSADGTMTYAELLASLYTTLMTKITTLADDEILKLESLVAIVFMPSETQGNFTSSSSNFTITSGYTMPNSSGGVDIWTASISSSVQRLRQVTISSEGTVTFTDYSDTVPTSGNISLRVNILKQL